MMECNFTIFFPLLFSVSKGSMLTILFLSQLQSEFGSSKSCLGRCQETNDKAGRCRSMCAFEVSMRQTSVFQGGVHCLHCLLI